jgi:hypothetical protein
MTDFPAPVIPNRTPMLGRIPKSRTGSSGDKSARKMTETEFVDAE